MEFSRVCCDPMMDCLMENNHLSPRMLELLEKAADAFVRNFNPFESEWLTLHDVTLEECADLSELIGKVLEDYWYEQTNKEE